LNYTGKLASSVESKIACGLFERIEQERKVPSWVEEMPPEMRQNYKDDDFVPRALKSLPVLSREPGILAKWWKVMEALFVRLYGEEFEKRSAFKSYWHPNHPVYRRLKANEKRSAIRRDIKKKLKQGLRSIAAKQPDVINSESI
jgi:hypothetical protein